MTHGVGTGLIVGTHGTDHLGPGHGVGVLPGIHLGILHLGLGDGMIPGSHGVGVARLSLGVGVAQVGIPAGVQHGILVLV